MKKFHVKVDLKKKKITLVLAWSLQTLSDFQYKIRRNAVIFSHQKFGDDYIMCCKTLDTKFY